MFRSVGQRIALFPFIGLALMGLLSATTACRAPGSTARPIYPESVREEVRDELHGVAIADPYRWLEAEASPAVQAWVAAQNAFTKRTLAPLADVQAQVARELAAVYAVEEMSNIEPGREAYFFTLRSGDENHPKLYVRHDHYALGKTAVALDPNTFSADGTVALDWWFPSPNGEWVAYGKSAHGSEKSTLHIRSLASDRDLDECIPFTQYCSVAWSPTSDGFYYNRCPDPATVPPGEENFHMRVYYHRLFSDPASDRYVWGRDRPIDEEPRPYTSCDGKYVLLNFYRDPSENDLYFGEFNAIRPLRPVAAGLGAITNGDVVEGRLFLRTNHQAPRFRICTTTVAQPGPEYWRDLVPEQKGIIASFTIADHKLVVHVTEDVHSRLLVYGLDGVFLEEIPLPGLGSVNDYVSGVGTVDSLAGRLWDTGVFFSFSSWISPSAVYRYDLRGHRLELLHQTPCPVDLRRYETKQVWATSKDGTAVPMFVVARRDIVLDGNNPTLLYGYGGFNMGFYPRYRPRIIPFLERGGVWVLANIRGGGEFGQAWHNGGRRAHKQNCFDDFYACAERLIELGYTSPRKLACQGGSNGGLLIGAAVTQRPDLFQAAIAQVPLMDMLRFHLWGMGAQWVHEYGDPRVPEEFAWLRAYSPYHNVQAGVDYPATLIATAEADNRVATAHAFKMTAALQAATSGTRPILLRCEQKAGHGAGKPLSMRIEHEAQEWTFLMWQLGMLGT